MQENLDKEQPKKSENIKPLVDISNKPFRIIKEDDMVYHEYKLLETKDYDITTLRQIS